MERLVEAFIFTCEDGRRIAWDITRAKHEVALGHVVARDFIALDEMREIVRRNEPDPSRVAQADPSQPGIAAPIVWQGQVIWVLIDGTHRCARALELGQRFEAALLDEVAAARCVIAANEGLVP